MVNMMKPTISSSGFLVVFVLCWWGLVPGIVVGDKQELRFDQNGQFKILQVADMHYGNDQSTPCKDILPTQQPCSDLNTTAFLDRVIEAEKPHLIVFTGDNIFGWTASDAAESMNKAFAPAIASNIPWVAILGNHDQESNLSREKVMQHIVGLKNTLSQVNPPDAAGSIDGFGNYNLEVAGIKGSLFENKSLLNLYFLDSGDYALFSPLPIYNWIKRSQQRWYQTTSKRLQAKYMSEPYPQNGSAPGLVYFHIPLPDFKHVDFSNILGEKQEKVLSPIYNSGFFKTLVNTGDVKAVFTGHDHTNDFCGELSSIQLCYAGGFGYHAYGKAGWHRRARVVLASLENKETGWGAVKSITSWKLLDDEDLTVKDYQVLWSKIKAEAPRKKQVGEGRKASGTSLLTDN